MQKILVIRFSSIGDIVLTSPIVRVLASKENFEVHFLTKKRFGSLVQDNPHIRQVHLFDKNMPQLLSSLRAENYDYLIDLHNNLRSWRMALALGVKRRAFPKLNWKKWLMVNTKINGLPDLHIVDRYFQTIKGLACSNDNQGLEFFLPSGISWPEALPEHFNSAEPYLVAAIGGAHATKRMPVSQWVKALKELNLPILIVGGKEDAIAGETIHQEISKATSLCGKISLLESAFLIQKAKVVATHDTGMMHIAAAFKKPILSIWGNTIPAFGMYPYYGAHQIDHEVLETTPLACRPCSKIGFDQCPKGHFKCMKSIPPSAVANQIKALWRANS